ncbi:hypothetical protein JCGZ_14898 [Jatropha curcas]|uniref:Uncharacterized protein n=1 Tax=Jatropha curcas TaxID=180498 RepID=A0A067K6B2_JATCU|nr:hypothetical protein JCGZ_14898 [Jatropha curcas]
MICKGIRRDSQPTSLVSVTGIVRVAGVDHRNLSVSLSLSVVREVGQEHGMGRMVVTVGTRSEVQVARMAFLAVDRSENAGGGAEGAAIAASCDSCASYAILTEVMAMESGTGTAAGGDRNGAGFR